MLSSGTSNATLRRRFQFQRRRCCSTPAMASLSDFPDSFFEEIKSKIIIHDSDKEEAESSEESVSPTCDSATTTTTTATTTATTTHAADAVSEAVPGERGEDVETATEGRQNHHDCCKTHCDDRVFEGHDDGDKDGDEHDLTKAHRNFTDASRGDLAEGYVPDATEESELHLSEADEFATTANFASNPNAKAVVFSLRNQVGGLVRALRVFKEKNVNVQHIESRKSKRNPAQYEIFVSVDCDSGTMGQLVHGLEHELDCVDLKRFHENDAIFDNNNDQTNNTPMSPPFDDEDPSAEAGPELFEGMPWFPRKISDLDKTANRVLMYGRELDADHPGFKDQVYRKRRMYYCDLAMSYRSGLPIPRVEYTDEEKNTWRCIFRKLSALYETHACREFLENFKLLRKYKWYREDDIPQLEDVSNFLKERTGFTLRPVAGYLSARDFLSGLAFRVFHCTQYIRHSSDPFYTPEPDCCHELLGHCPLLADASFAQFSQELGLASLGASDAEVDKLATCYFFTVEFGLCQQNGEMKVYGAGLLSSAAELEYVLSPKANVLPFDPNVTCEAEPQITTFQKMYFYTDSFNEAKHQMREFAKTIKRPFGLRYNPYTQSVEVLSNTQRIAGLVSELKGDLCIVTNALSRLRSARKRQKSSSFAQKGNDATPTAETSPAAVETPLLKALTAHTAALEADQDETRNTAQPPHSSDLPYLSETKGVA